MLTPILYCVALGNGIAFIELLVAAYSGPWLGGTRAEWASWRLTALVFIGVITFVGAPAALMLRWVLPNSFRAIRPFVTYTLVASILGAALAVGAGNNALGLILLLVFLPWSFLAYVSLLRARGVAEPIRTCGVLLLALASGILAVRTASSLQYLLRDTSVVVSAIACASALFSLAVSTTVIISVNSSGRIRVLRAGVLLLGAIFAPATLVGWPYLLTPRARADNPPNVLLITSDALRADYCSTFGGQVPTPNLTALANRGTKFNMCYSAAPWTVPSLCSIFSAKYPPGLTPTADVYQREHEQLSYRELASYWLEPDGTGSISQFQKMGYETAAFCANGAISDQQWLLNQFDHTVVANALEIFGPSPLALNPLTERCVQTMFPAFLTNEPKDLTAEARHFAKVFLRVHSERPFFLWIHFLDPHSPYDPPERFRNNLAPKDKSFSDDFHSHDPGDSMSPEQARALYGGEIQYMDEGVGEILDTLHTLGLTDNTIVCFSADHGEELFDHGQIGHGHSMYNEVVHVPLIMAGPAIEHGEVTAPVSTINIMPTLLSILDKPAPMSWQGQSMKTALMGLPCPALDKPCFVQATHEFVPHTEPKQMVRDGQYKYVRLLTTGERLLFDELKDKQENTNLVEELPDVAARLDKELDNWQGTFPANFTAATEARPYRTVKLSAPDPELREHLHALGYL